MKPKNIKVDGYDFFFWNYEPQTKMKHQVLSEYFLVWAQKLGIASVPCFFDCHGGSGAYLEDGVPRWGSSIILAEKAAGLYSKYKKRVDFFVCERDSLIYDNLCKVIAFRKLQNRIFIKNDAFEDVIQGQKPKQYFLTHPTLFFVDPCGYSIKISDITYLMSFNRCEVLCNFMYDFINRFISVDTEEDKFNQLFGCTEWKKALTMSNLERELFIVGLFKKQIKQLSGAKYVFPYRLSFPDKDRTYYYLFHITNHYDGCAIMKSCFATHNYGKVEYAGNRSGIFSFFDMAEVKSEEIETYLANRYSGRELTFERICGEIIDDTMYLEKEVRSAIKSMRNAGKIKTTPVTSKTHGLKGKDIVRFEV